MHIAIILFFGNLFSSDMIIIIFVGLILFGGEKLPEIARGLGKGIRDFKDASEGVKREINNQINSYEEKREEKKMEETILINQKAAELSAEKGEQHLIEGQVENTVPYNDNLFIEDKHAETGTPTGELHTGTENENHDAASHPDNGNTTEHIKV
jgi:sec-independent protein translocase protein TatA